MQAAEVNKCQKLQEQMETITKSEFFRKNKLFSKASLSYVKDTHDSNLFPTFSNFLTRTYLCLLGYNRN